MNAVNKWISAGKTPKEKDKRRYIVAGAAIAGGVALSLIWWPLGIPLLVIGVVKIKNAITDKS